MYGRVPNKGRDNTPYGDFDHMAGQSDAKTQQQKPQPQGPGAPGEPPEAAPLWSFGVGRLP
eukprot:9423361-Heterocapsa_arctica.AAC.1